MNTYRRPFFFKAPKNENEKITQIDTGREVLDLTPSQNSTKSIFVNDLFDVKKASNPKNMKIQDKIKKKSSS